MAEFTLQALHDEIEADPQSIGYKDGGEWKADSVIADLINAKVYKIDRLNIGMEDARATVPYEAYNALLADEQEWLRWMTPDNGEFRVNADMKLLLSGRTLTSNGVAGTGDNDSSFWNFANRDVVAPAFLALIEIDGSRAEVLWDEGKVVSISEIGHASNL